MKDFNLIFPESWRKGLGEVVKSFSARTSSCPDLLKEIWVKDNFVKDPDTAVAVLMILPLCCPGVRNYGYIENLRTHIGKMVSNYNYEGKWKLVGEILSETTSLEVFSIWTKVLNSMSVEDFFGNMFPILRKAVRSLKWRRTDYSVVTDKRPYRKPLRKRGYDDKGSRRDPSRAYLGTIHPSRVKEKVAVSIRLPRSFAWYASYGCQQNEGGRV